MTIDHTRWESLAGAIALGEATESEREQFELHTADCTRCCEHRLDELAVVRDHIVAMREKETWRPSLGTALMNRIRAERLRRSRLTLRVLSWSVALSLALDAAFVSGVTSYAGRVVDATGTSMSNIAASYRTAQR